VGSGETAAVGVFHILIWLRTIMWKSSTSHIGRLPKQHLNIPYSQIRRTKWIYVWGAFHLFDNDAVFSSHNTVALLRGEGTGSLKITMLSLWRQWLQLSTSRSYF